MCMNVLVYSCGGQRLSLGVTLCHPTLYLVEKIPLPEPGVHKLTRLAGQKSLKILLSPLPLSVNATSACNVLGVNMTITHTCVHVHIFFKYMDVMEKNTGFQDYTASDLPRELALQVPIL